MHYTSKSFLIIFAVFSTLTAGSWYISTGSAEPSPCEPGQIYVDRVVGGYEKTPASNPFGQCVSDEDLKGNMVEKPTAWSEFKQAIRSALSIEKAHAAGATYHVRQDGRGSCMTIGACLGRLQPGDTLIIHGGTYSESELQIPGGSSESSRVTVTGAPGETVKVNRLAIPPNSHYVTIQNLIIDGSKGTQHGLWIEGTHTRLRFVTVQDVQGNTSYDSQASGVGIALYRNNKDQFTEILDSKVLRTGASNPRCSTKPDALGCHGIYMASHHNLVDRSEIADNNGMGIQVYFRGGAPSYNVLRNSTWYGSRWGNNIGVYWGTGNQIYNNIVYGGVWDGIFNNGSNTLIANNTIYGNGRAGILNQGSATIKNNIVVNNDEGDIQGCDAARSRRPAKGRQGQENRRGNCSNNLTTDPGFVNASGGNFHLRSGSPAIDAGMTLPEVACDIEGTARPAGSAYDIGAFEYGGTPGSGCSKGSGGTTPQPSPSPSPAPRAPRQKIPQRR